MFLGSATLLLYLVFLITCEYNSLTADSKKLTDLDKKTIFLNSPITNSNQLKQNILNDLSKSSLNWRRHDYTCPGTPKICWCDNMCEAYGDCCIDKVPQPSRATYICEKLGMTDKQFYMKKSCPDAWKHNMTREYCEKDSVFAKDPTYRNDVPIYHIKLRVLFRNYYCLLCNNASQNKSDIYDWKDRIVWLHQFPTMNISLLSADDYKYLPDKRYYEVRWKGKTYHAGYEATEYNDPSFGEKFNARSCLQVISDCPTTASNDLKKKCQDYTAFVYNLYDDRVYRNYHCALCHHQSVLNLRPGWPPTQTAFTPLNHVWYPDIFDFGTDDNPNERCPRNKIFDVLLNTCLPFRCPDDTSWKGKKCIANNGTEVCPWVILEAEWVTFLPNGYLYLNYTKQTLYEGQYETITNTKGIITHVRVCILNPTTLTLDPAQEILSEICLFISIVCLCIQLIIYIIFKNLRTRPGKILMCLSVSILIGHISFIIAGDVPHFTDTCYGVAVIIHYFYTCSFFWMNVMAVDVCRNLVTHVFDFGGKRMFLWYSIYAWTVPGLIVLSAILVDHIIPDAIISPQYGQMTCWIGHRYGLLVFFVAPVAIILIINTGIFIITARSLRRYNERKDRLCKQTERTRFMLYVKLALVIGLTWIFGFIAALTKLNFMWYPFIIFNGLQGAFIFLAFTVKRKIYKEAHNTWKKHVASRRDSTSTIMSRLSSAMSSFRKPGKGMPSAPAEKTSTPQLDKRVKWAPNLEHIEENNTKETSLTGSEKTTTEPLMKDGSELQELHNCRENMSDDDELTPIKSCSNVTNC